MIPSPSLSMPSQPLSTNPSLLSSRPLTRKRNSAGKVVVPEVCVSGGTAVGPRLTDIDEQLGVRNLHRADDGVIDSRVVDPHLVADPDVPVPRGRRIEQRLMLGV